MKNKFLEMKKKLSEHRKRAVALLLVGSMILGMVPITAAADEAEPSSAPLAEKNDGNMNIVPYNNDDLRVDVASGGWATPVVADVNNDKVLDIILGSNSTPYSGVMVFHGTKNAQKEGDDYLLMENAEIIKKDNHQPLGSSIYAYDVETGLYGDYDKTLVTGWGTAYGDAKDYPSVSSDYGYGMPSWNNNPDLYVELLAAVEQEVFTITGTTTGTIKANNHMYVDYDGDGDLDLIYSVDSYGEYGWVYGQDSRYNKDGIKGNEDDSVWGDDGDDPIRSWTFWFENTGDQYATKAGANFSDYQNPKLVTLTTEEGKKVPVDTYAGSTPQFYDWDFDGDLDIICGDIFGDFTYFENVGSRTVPEYKEGRKLLTPEGDVLHWRGQTMLTLTSADWNQDQYMDLIVSGEDGRVVLIEHSKTKTENDGTPIMKAPQCFQMPAESVKGGMEFTPFSVDWDEDGDEDIIAGNALGYICFIENLSVKIVEGKDIGTGKKDDPSWEKPVPLRTPDEKIYRITAGDSLVEGVVGAGSPQGPAENNWGYTTVTVGDWDGDGIRDILSSNSWGRIYFHKGIEGDSTHVEEAQPVEVEWENGNIYPSWNWWTPEGNELVTVWRSTPFMIDLPLEDTDGDGDADSDDGDGLMDLVTLDHEGYLAYYERYSDANGNLKLKEGKRIFKDNTGETFRLRSGDYGENGRIKFTIVDYDQDGMLDIIYTDVGNGVNVEYARNISNTPGEYVFSVGDMLHKRQIYNHAVAPTVCDWDENDVPDLLMGAEDGHMYYLLNNVAGKDEDVEEETPPSLDDYLVAHWDFEGEGDAIWDDKASGGVNDKLSVYNHSGGAPTVTDGVVAFTGRGGGLQAEDSPDLDITGEMTIFLRASVWGSGHAFLLDKFDNDTQGLNIDTELNSSYTHVNIVTNEAEVQRWNGTPIAANGSTYEWRNVAFTISRNEVDGNLVLQGYLSKSDPIQSAEDFEAFGEPLELNIKELPTNDIPLTIGNCYDLSEQNNVWRYFDDIRIYKKALSLGELVEHLEGEAPEEKPESLDDYMVAHWDFEGTGDEVYQDKATGGVKDTLAVLSSTSTTTPKGEVTVSDGVASIKGRGAGLRAENSSDLNITGEMTIFMKVSIDGSTGYDLLSKSSTTSGYGYRVHAGNTATEFQLATGETAATWTGSVITKQLGMWRELAFIVSRDAETGNLMVQGYQSKSAITESAADFEALGTAISLGSSTQSTNNLPLTIGTNYENDNSAWVDRYFDDVRIYNKALSLDELATHLDGQEPIRIACVGDSITQGMGRDHEGNDNEPQDAYPVQLQGILGSDYQVLNAGVGGHGALRNLMGHRYYGDEQAYQTSLDFAPNIVLMMLGTNDASDYYVSNYSETGWNDNVKEEFKKDYSGLLESYLNLATNPKVYIVLPTYCYEVTEYTDGNGELIVLNRQSNLENYVIPALREIADEYDIEIIDMQSFTSDHEEWFPDKIHPDEIGYSYMAGEFARHIYEYLGVEVSSLVAHWDFVDDGTGNGLADKASGKNPLNVGTTGNVQVSNGQAIITGNGYLQAVAAGLNVDESMTVFVRAKVDKLGWCTLLNKHYSDGSNVLNTKGYILSLYPQEEGVPRNGTMLRYKENYFTHDSMVAGEWREMAIVVNKDQEGFYTYKFLMSKNEATADGNDFVTYYTRKTPIAEHVAPSTDLIIGSSETESVTRYFDDIQIYNRALTADELAKLINPSDLNEGNDTKSYHLKSLDNTLGFGYFEHIAKYTAATEQESVTLTPVAEDAGVVIKVNNEVVSSGNSKVIYLVEGANTVNITLGDGTNVYRTYTISITRNALMTEKLAALVAKVNKYENTGYDTWDSFAEALEQAEALLESENLNEDDARKSYKALSQAETQLFTQKNLPAISLKGFRHVTLEDFGLTSKTYTTHEAGNLDTIFDQTILSIKVDFDEYYYDANRIDIGAFDLWLWKDTLLRMDRTSSAIPNIDENYVGIDLSKAGITSGLDEFLLQISFEYKDYDGDGADDGMLVNVYANGKLVSTKDYTGCRLENMSRTLQIQQSIEGHSMTVNSVIGDAHADGALDPRDLVAVAKKASGTDLGNTYENTVADVNRQEPVDKTDVVVLRSKLLE